MAMKKKTPKGYHRMPNGKLMKGSTHSSTKKKNGRQSSNKRGY